MSEPAAHSSDTRRPRQMPVARRPLPLALVLAALAVAAVLTGLAAGSAGLGADATIVWEVRAPRVAAGFATGAALALAGALMQLLTRNALADPYVLGVSGGASVGALAVLTLGVPLLGGVWGTALGAAAGAAAATLLLLALTWRLAPGPGLAGTDAGVSVLLVGVMIGSAGSAVVALLLTLAPDAQLRGMVFWLLGDLGGAVPASAGWAALAGALALTWPWARELDWLARGDAWAASLGVAVPRRRRQVMLAAALATGGAVATAGAIGFVGLVVPHALRLLGVRDAALLLPASALAGGSFLVLVDAAARTVAAPIQLPVGVLASAIGVPVFLVLLLQRPRRSA